MSQLFCADGQFLKLPMLLELFMGISASPKGMLGGFTFLSPGRVTKTKEENPWDSAKKSAAAAMAASRRILQNARAAWAM